MGTAPRAARHPAMPDPVKLVTKSLSLLKRLGYSDDDALSMIAMVAATALNSIAVKDARSVLWLTQVITAALDRAAVLTPSHSDNPGDDNADGRSSRTGRTTEN